MALGGDIDNPSAPQSNQNLWETINADTGSTTANIPTDTLTIAGGAGQKTSIAGDTVTIQHNIAVNAQTGNYTVLASDKGKFLPLSGNSGGAGFTYTFTTAPTLGDGWYCYIANYSDTTLTLIDAGFVSWGGVGAITVQLDVGDGGIVICTGSNLYYIKDIVKPAGVNKDIQFNSYGSFGVDSGNFTYDAYTGNGTLQVGSNAIQLYSPITDTLCLGIGVGNTTMDGIRNCIIGTGGTGGSITTADVVMAFGYQVFTNLTIGSNNFGFGTVIGGGITSANNAVLIGNNVQASGNYSDICVIGRNVNATADNQIVIGNVNGLNGYNDMYVGTGVVHTAPSSNVTIQATGGEGTNIAGSNTVIAGGKNTGNSVAGGDIIFKTSDAGTSGSTLQTLAESARIKTDTQNFVFNARVLEKQGNDVASAADITLGYDGNTFVITGTTQISAITTTGWQNGSKVTLLFSSTPTVKHNTAGGAGTAVILLAGAVDFVATAGDTLTLVLSTLSGVQAWRQYGGAVI